MTNVIKWTLSKYLHYTGPRHKDFVYVNFFIVYDVYQYVIFFAMYVDHFLCLMKLNNA